MFIETWSLERSMAPTIADEMCGIAVTHHEKNVLDTEEFNSLREKSLFSSGKVKITVKIFMTS